MRSVTHTDIIEAAGLDPDQCECTDGIDIRARQFSVVNLAPSDPVVVDLSRVYVGKASGPPTEYTCDSYEGAVAEYARGQERLDVTYWVYAWAWRRAYTLVDGDVVEIDVDDSTHVMGVDPHPPKCIERNHIWRKDGQISLRPDGGSEKRYMCETCGVYNKVVTVCGDECSVVSVSYEPPDRYSVAWVVRNARRIWEAKSASKETA